MLKIGIISASVRKGRNSHRVSLYFQKYLEENKLADSTMIDLKVYDFPIFEERLSHAENPTEAMFAFAKSITDCDGIIIVTPEYNGGYPASLKNAIDLLHPEWKRKPIGIATVSAGIFGGTQVITSLQFSLWKIGALMIPATFPVSNVEKTFDEKGVAMEGSGVDKRANMFISELLYWIKAKKVADI